MRLLAGRSGHESSGEDGASRSAHSLWKHVRGEPHPPVSDPESSELLAVADVTREAFDASPESPQLAPGATFSTVHQRLMEAITASRELDGEERLPPHRRSDTLWPREKNHRSSAWRSAVKYVFAMLLFLAAGFGGHQLGRKTVPVFPVSSLVEDFDNSLKSPEPLGLVGDNNHAAAAWLRGSTGIHVHLPSQSATGMHLLGARRGDVNGTTVALTHYEKNGVRVVLYQLNAPRVALDGLNQINLNGRAYFTQDYGAYHVVAWRSGDNVLAVVSPLPVSDALQLAVQMRTHPQPDTFASGDETPGERSDETEVDYDSAPSPAKPQTPVSATKP